MRVRACIVFIACIATAGCARNSSNPETAVAASEPVLQIDTAVIETTEVRRAVQAVGTLDPNEEVTVTNQVEGNVQRVLVDLGDAVRQGQLIAELDTRELLLNVEQQRAALQQELARLGLTDPAASLDEAGTTQVRQAEANFEEARVRFERLQKLSADGVVPQQQFDEQRAKYAVAEAALRASRETVRNIRATVSSRKAALDLAQKKLEDARVLAPISGLVMERLTTTGQYLRANSPVVTLVQNSPLKLKVDVPEAALSGIRAGGPVEFSVDAIPNRKFTGRISRLAPAVSQSSRTLKLEAIVANPDGLLKPGFFARVAIQTDRLEKVLVGPASAVISFAGLEKLYVVEQGKIAERVVRTGLKLDGDRVEILDGIKEGEIVAVSNLAALQQGREVKTR